MTLEFLLGCFCGQTRELFPSAWVLLLFGLLVCTLAVHIHFLAFFSKREAETIQEVQAEIGSLCKIIWFWKIIWGAEKPTNRQIERSSCLLVHFPNTVSDPESGARYLIQVPHEGGRNLTVSLGAYEQKPDWERSRVRHQVQALWYEIQMSQLQGQLLAPYTDTLDPVLFFRGLEGTDFYFLFLSHHTDRNFNNDTLFLRK